MRKKEKLVIDREVWLRGESDSYLVRPDDGKMCCLGIYLNDNGVTCDDMTNATNPSVVSELIPQNCKWLMSGYMEDKDNNLCASLMSVNDYKGYHKEEIREDDLIQLFAQANVEVEFIN